MLTRLNGKFSILPRGLLLGLFIFLSGTAALASHPNIMLYDKDSEEINPIAEEGIDRPFSTKVTCGLCHDYDEITSGYHFQHGWDVVSDTFGLAIKKPWILSNGMMGGWSPPSFRQLAKKENLHADEIDMTSYAFVGFSKTKYQPTCGACHAGGGGMEYDREGNRYDEYLAENPELKEALDGDYYKSEWDKSGVVEADCFICHMEGYDFSSRVDKLEDGNYQWAVVAGSRIGEVSGSVKKGQEPKVIYNRRFFNDDGTVTLKMSYPPPDDNCMFCHGSSDARKRGFSWNDIFNTDIHNQQGISCAACHPAGPDHQFARGDSGRSTSGARREKTIMSCAECHYEGNLGAIVPDHVKVRPSHLDRITCEACHIPQLGRAAIQGFDASSGKLEYILNPTDADRIGEKATWKPIYQRMEDQNIHVFNEVHGVFWGNLDTNGIIYILFLDEHAAGWKLFADQVTDDNGDGIPEVNTEAEIIAGLKAFSQALQNNQRFGQIKPVYLKGDQVIYLDQSGKPARMDYGFETNFLYAIDHNVAPTHFALGEHGCQDCHAQEAHFFKGKRTMDLYGQDGQPVVASMGRAFGCNPLVFWINSFHQRILSPLVSFLIIFIVFLITLHYHRFGPKRIPFIYGSGEVKRFSFLERGVHLFRLIAFILLTITGLIMAFNLHNWQELLFTSYRQMLLFHIISGLVFIATTIMGIGLWFKDAVFASYDKAWVKLFGGYLGHEGEVPAGRFNAGQKMFFWFTALFGIVMSLTGLILVFKYSFRLSTICLISTIHNLFAFFMIAGVLAHAYLGTIANPGTWRVLIDGFVTKVWAEHHHPIWYRKIMEKAENKDAAESDPEGGDNKGA